MWWLQAFELWAVNRLLRSPAFHQMVRNVHRRITGIKHGPNPEEMGGTNIDHNSGFRYFLRLFKEEIKEQLKDKRSRR
ncbi:hypothetical protein VTN49DRAFT_5397 [Thermomyces lanuginosus]|uniref:uncharacterized protein n=1 Tax=Thermomyces lanuginosus TaxID=5541 RepID=UPI003743E428